MHINPIYYVYLPDKIDFPQFGRPPKKTIKNIEDSTF
jgi:hypothetical protein